MYNLLLSKKNKISVCLLTDTQSRGGNCGNLITGDGSRGEGKQIKRFILLWSGWTLWRRKKGKGGQSNLIGFWSTQLHTCNSTKQEVKFAKSEANQFNVFLKVHVYWLSISQGAPGLLSSGHPEAELLVLLEGTARRAFFKLAHKCVRCHFPL